MYITLINEWTHIKAQVAGKSEALIAFSNSTKASEKDFTAVAESEQLSNSKYFTAVAP